MSIFRLLFFFLVIAFGGFLGWFGEIDDSPGGMLLGVVLIIVAIVALAKRKTTNLMPKSKLGKLSVMFIIAMPMLFFIGSTLTDTLYEPVSSGRTIAEDIIKRPALALTMLAGMGAGVGAFILGFISILKKKERAFLVYISTLMGMLLTLFLMAEIVFPH